MKYYDFLRTYLREKELTDIPNIVKIFDNNEPDTEYNSFWVHGKDVKNIGAVYLGSEVFDHHLLIKWANKILTNHYHPFDIVRYKARHCFLIKLEHSKENEKRRLLIEIPYDLTVVIDLSYELDKKYATENRVKDSITTNIQFTVDTSKVKSDPVNSPTHYQMGLIETIDSIKNILGHEKFQDYCIGNVIKYLSRYREKNGLEDLRKAETYIGFIIKSYEECTTIQ